MENYPRYILMVSCPEAPGILGRLGQFLSEHKLYVRDAAHFGDQERCMFFFRGYFEVREEGLDRSKLAEAFQPIAEEFRMEWNLYNENEGGRLLVLVSRYGHCLDDLLYQHRHHELPGEIVAVASNHETFKDEVEGNGLPFHYLPVRPETKPQQEEKLLGLIDYYKPDYIVLARYMQLLSPGLIARYPGRIINIHHSLLPSFKGAKPFRQAWERGVKMIGATAHFVTAELDAGPIIEQDVERVDHKHTPKDIGRISEDIERTVLTRAVTYLTEKRVLINGQRTVVFH